MLWDRRGGRPAVKINAELPGLKLLTLRLLRNAPAKTAARASGEVISPEAASAQFSVPPNAEMAQKSSVFASGIGYSLSLKYFS